MRSQSFTIPFPPIWQSRATTGSRNRQGIAVTYCQQRCCDDSRNSRHQVGAGGSLNHNMRGSVRSTGLATPWCSVRCAMSLACHTPQTTEASTHFPPVIRLTRATSDLQIPQSQAAESQPSQIFGRILLLEQQGQKKSFAQDVTAEATYGRLQTLSSVLKA